MDEEEIYNAFLSIIGLALFFSFATIGLIIAGLNPDSYLYIDFKPDIDLLVIVLLLILDDLLFFYYLIKISIFKKSSDLNYRKRELLIFSDKLQISCLFFVPIQLFLFYFLTKYFSTDLFVFLLFTTLLATSLIPLIFYTSFQIKRSFSN